VPERSATLNPDHPNCCAPRKRAVNTILPWSISTADGLRRLGGTPGGFGHPIVGKAALSGVRRIVERGPGYVCGVDDGRQEGLTIGW